MTEVKPLIVGADGPEQIDPTVDEITLAGLTVTGNVDMSSLGKVTNLAPPTVATDAATMGYVDTTVPGTGGDGIDVTGIVVSVDLHATPGLEFNGSKLRFKIADSTLQNAAAGASVAGVPATFTIDGSPVSSNVTKANVDQLVDDTDAKTVIHWHEDRTTKIMSETVTQWEPICVSDTADNRFRRAIANSVLQRADVMGIIMETTSLDEEGDVAGEGAILVGAIAGATRGDLVYLGAAGGLTLTAPAAPGDYQVPLGRALDATTMVVKYGATVQVP